MSDRKDRKKVIVKVLIVALIAAAVLIVTVWAVEQYKHRYRDYVERIDTLPQEFGGVTMTNYVAMLSSDVDWDASEDKEGIAKYAVGVALGNVDTVEVREYNILGQTSDYELIFTYNRQTQEITLYMDGESIGVAQYD